MTNEERHKQLKKIDLAIPKEVELQLSEEYIFIIEEYGHWLNALERHIIQPITEEQKRFLDVCAGKLEAENVYEKAWLSYKKIISRPIQCSLCSGRGYYGTVPAGGRVTCRSCNGSGRFDFSQLKRFVSC